ncbi:hypothetical protein [Sphingomonas sp.]|jgi:hypothetical protein|uniref:hypothetical protein n=1 Tax=Sphingomonas sp. TaxID=28214 RepID=UPI002EDADA05
MSTYAEIDPIIEKWVAALNTTLFTEWANAPARFFHTPGDPPFECFQISVDAPEDGKTSVHARAVDTNDDTEDELTRTWTGPVADCDVMMSAAVETIAAWKSRRREKPDPPSPWQ